jgi:HEAT repeat protein
MIRPEDEHLRRRYWYGGKEVNLPLPDELTRALEAEEAEGLNEIIRAHREGDFESLRGLVSTDPSVDKGHRNKALYALGRWGNPSVVPDIERVLPELDETGRIAAIDALGQLGTEQALEAVTRYSSDPAPQVRKAVVLALSRIGAPEAQTRLRAMANEDPEEWIRGLAARHLEKR